MAALEVVPRPRTSPSFQIHLSKGDKLVVQGTSSRHFLVRHDFCSVQNEEVFSIPSDVHFAVRNKDVCSNVIGVSMC